MTKTLFLLAVVLSACTAGGHKTVVQSSPNSFELADRVRMQMMHRRSVKVNWSCKLKPASLMGSGAVVAKKDGKTVIVTAAHVADFIITNNCEIIVEDYRGISGYGTVLSSDEDTDIAIIELGEDLGEVAPLSKKPYLGQPITCVGWPSLPYKDYEGQSITRGFVSTLGVDEFIRISADLYFGNSGGACYSDYGEVVGIVSHFMIGGVTFGVVTPAPGQFYISHVNNVKKLLD